MVNGNSTPFWHKHRCDVGRCGIVQLQGQPAEIPVEGGCYCLDDVLGSHQAAVLYTHGCLSIVAAIQEQDLGDIPPCYYLTNPLSRQGTVT